jgi:hypothetical protein
VEVVSGVGRGAEKSGQQQRLVTYRGIDLISRYAKHNRC